MTPANWIAILTKSQWERLRSGEVNVVHFPARRKGTAGKINPDDVILIYVKELSVFMAAVAAAGRISGGVDGEGTPCVTLPVRPHVDSASGLGVDPVKLKERLTIFHGVSPTSWTDHFRLSPALWQPADAALVVRSLMEGEGAPGSAEAKTYSSSALGEVSVPGGPEDSDYPEEAGKGAGLLAGLGRSEGYTVWIHPRLGRKAGAVSDPAPQRMDTALARAAEAADMTWFLGDELKNVFCFAMLKDIPPKTGRLADVAALAQGRAHLYMVCAKDLFPEVQAASIRPHIKLCLQTAQASVRFIALEELLGKGPHFTGGGLESLWIDCSI